MAVYRLVLGMTPGSTNTKMVIGPLHYFFSFQSSESYAHTAGAVVLPFTISVGDKFILF